VPLRRKGKGVEERKRKGKGGKEKGSGINVD
jgi:hypothetical protein